jgi:hypothetical protein
MAESINRVCADGESTACIEVVFTGDASGETDTIVDVSALSGGAGGGTERVRVKSVKALVVGDPTAGANVQLSWAGSGDVFAFLPTGVTDIDLSCSPTAGSTGDIIFTSTASTPFTLRLTVQKTRGFALSTSKITSLDRA